jgi:hypothetical protein
MKILSLGAGVQSTTLALMAASGELGDMPDAAIFADTGDEPQAVYDHLNWLKGQNLPFPIHVIGYGSMSNRFLAGDASAQPPLFTRTKKGVGMLTRQCTRNYKVYPITRKVRELLGYGPRGKIPQNSAEVWIGISMDEIFRMRPSRVAYIQNKHPLIDKRMTRRDCLTWLEESGYPRPPKSSCWHCPYQTSAQWRDKKENYPEEWKKAVALDEALRSETMTKRLKGQTFLHSSGVPLIEADLSTLEDHGQLNLFLNECEGMCGV